MSPCGASRPFTSIHSALLACEASNDVEDARNANCAERDAQLSREAFDLLCFAVMACPCESRYIQPFCELPRLNEFVIDMLLHTPREKVNRVIAAKRLGPCSYPPRACRFAIAWKRVC